jgi:hypothetical protein
MLNRFVFAFWVLFYFSPTVDAATYYVANNGSTTSCTAMQDITTPASSILAAIECANDSTGNIVEIRGGNYDETLGHTHSPTDWPRGTSWSDPAIIRAYPGEIVRLRPTFGAEHISFTSYHTGAYYLSIENLQFDSSGITYFHSDVWGYAGGGVNGGAGQFTASYATDVRFKGNTFLHSGNTHVSGELYKWWFDGNTFLGCGDTGGDHCLYIGGGDIVLENNIMAETTGGGYCVQFYDGAATPVKSIILRNNTCRDSIGAGFTLHGTTLNQVYNNTFERITGDAVSVFGGTNNSVEIVSNKFSDIGNDAIVGNLSNVRISDNTFSNIRGSMIWNHDS